MTDEIINFDPFQVRSEPRIEDETVDFDPFAVQMEPEKGPEVIEPEISERSPFEPSGFLELLPQFSTASRLVEYGFRRFTGQEPRKPKKKEAEDVPVGDRLSRAAHNIWASTAQGVGDIAKAAVAMEKQRDPRVMVRAIGDIMEALDVSADEEILPAELYGASKEEKEKYFVEEQKRMLKESKDFLDSLPKGGEPGFKGVPILGTIEEAAKGITRFAVPMALNLVPGVGIPMGTGATFLALYGQKHDQLKKEGKPDSVANEASAIHAVLATPAEQIGNLLQLKGMGRVWRAILGKQAGRVKQLAIGMAQGALGEGWEEGVQAFTELFADIHAEMPSASFGKKIKTFWERGKSPEFLKEVGRQVTLGAVGGAILPFGAGLISTPIDLARRAIRKEEPAVEAVVGRIAEGLSDEELRALQAEAEGPEAARYLEKIVAKREGRKVPVAKPKEIEVEAERRRKIAEQAKPQIVKHLETLDETSLMNLAREQGIKVSEITDRSIDEVVDIIANRMAGVTVAAVRGQGGGVAELEPFVKRLDPAYKAGTIREAETTPEREAAQKVAKSLGARVTFIDPKGSALSAVDGLSYKNRIYIMSDAAHPVLRILGHETWHRVSQEHKDLADQILKTVKTDETFYKNKVAAVRAVRKKLGLPELKRGELTEEYLADFAGELFTRESFWRSLNNQNPTLAQRIAKVVRQVIEKIFNVSKTDPTVPTFKEASQIENAMTKVFKEVRKRVIAEVEDITAVEVKKGPLAMARKEAIGKGIHFRNTLLRKGDFLLATDREGKREPSGFSRSDIGNRLYSHTEKNPYAPLVYFYEAGTKPESQIVSTKRVAYNVDFAELNIYNSIEDLLDIRAKVKKRIKDDPGAHEVNILANLIKEYGYDGFLVNSPYGEGRWVLIFEKAAVTHAPAKVKIGISDVVDGIEKLPQNVAALNKMLEDRAASFYSRIAAVAGRYPEIRGITYRPGVARFEEATSGKLEIGGILSLEAPLSAVRSFISELGIENSQYQIYLMHSEGKPNGKMFRFKAHRKFKSLDELSSRLEELGMSEYNLTVNREAGSLWIEQFVVDDEKAFNDEARRNMAGAILEVAERGHPKNSVFDVNSEIIGSEIGETGDALKNYKKHIIDYFGREKGQEIYEQAQKRREEYRQEVKAGRKIREGIREQRRKVEKREAPKRAVREPAIVPETHRKKIDAAINLVAEDARNAMKTVVVDKISDLPKGVHERWLELRKSDKAAGLGIDKLTTAALTDRENEIVYIIASSVADSKEAVRGWLHEQIGHKALRDLFEAHEIEYNDFLDSVYDLVKDSDEFAEVAYIYGPSLSKLSPEEANREIAEEFLARRAERLDPEVRKSIYQRFRDFINKWFEKIFGLDLLKPQLGLFEQGERIIELKDIPVILEAAKNRLFYNEIRAFEETRLSDQEYVDMAKAAYEADPRIANWYKNHYDLINEKFGKDAPIVNALLALTSSAGRVENNGPWAIDTYLFLTGRGDKVGGRFPTANLQKVQEFVRGDIAAIQGKRVKIQEMVRALLGDPNATVHDRWIYRLFFGDPIWTKGAIEAFINANKTGSGLSDMASSYTVPENITARHKLFKITQMLTEQTGRIWTPVEAQATLWCAIKARTEGIPIKWVADYYTALQKPVPKYGGRTAIQWLDKEMKKESKYGINLGELHKTIQLPEKLFDQVSNLEKMYQDYMQQQAGKKDAPKALRGVKYDFIEVGPDQFMKSFNRAKNIEHAVRPSPEQLKKAKLFLIPGFDSGYALMPSGEIINPFNNTNVKGLRALALIDAVMNGGNKASIYSGHDFRFYESLGFGVANRAAWIDHYDPNNPAAFGQNKLAMKFVGPRDANILMGMYEAAFNKELGKEVASEGVTQSILSKFKDQKVDKAWLNKSQKTYDNGTLATTTRSGIYPTKNILVQTGKKRGKYLIVQMTSNRAREEATDMGQKYYDTLYERGDGYLRPADFWEVPQWMGEVANTLPDADVYVVRNIQEATQFLNQAGYKNVLFSAMDSNKIFIKRILNDYEGDSIIGGYIDPSYFANLDRAIYVDSIKEAAKKLGVKYKKGVDYRHFEGTRTIPRLEMSRGCLHKCAFCTVPKKIVTQSKANVMAQVDSFAKLKYDLIYLNDKTFGQAKNYQDLVDINKRVKKQNPNFKGFVIQTTAPTFNKLSVDFLQKSGIKYVELGVESFNDEILRKINKPHRRSHIETAVEKLRKLEMRFIPNIMVGLAGTETPGKIYAGGYGTVEVTTNEKKFVESFKQGNSHINGFILDALRIEYNTPTTLLLGIHETAGELRSNLRNELRDELQWNADDARKFADDVVKRAKKWVKENPARGGGLWTETEKTYKRTLDFLKKNTDIISHTNTYVLAVYEGTESKKQLGDQEIEADGDENVIEKSWLQNKELHEGFYRDVLDFATNQLKRNTERAPKIKLREDPDDRAMLSAKDLEILWYSEMQRVLSEKLPGKASPDQMWRTVQSWAKKGLFKSEELEWSGLEEFLEGKVEQESVTKKEIMDWLGTFGLFVDERLRDSELATPTGDKEFGDDGPPQIDINQRPRFIEPSQEYIEEEIEFKINERYRDEVQVEFLEEFEATQDRALNPKERREFFKHEEYDIEEEARKRAAEEINEFYEEYGSYIFDETNYGYSIEAPGLGDVFDLIDPDGNYIDQFSTIEDAHDALFDHALEKYGVDVMDEEDSTKYEQYTLPGGKRYRELLITMPHRIGKTAELERQIAELTRRGTRDELNPSEMAQLNYLSQKLQPISGELYQSAHWDESNVLAHIRFKERTNKAGEKILFIEEIQSDWHQEGRKEGYKGGDRIWRVLVPEQLGMTINERVHSVFDNEQAAKDTVARLNETLPKELPGAYTIEKSMAGRTLDAPFKKSWPIMAMKRAVRWAVSNGFDKVAWTTGQQQADRYDLSTRIETLSYTSYGDGTYEFGAFRPGDTEAYIIESNLSADDLERYLGKEIAQKIIDGQGDEVVREDDTVNGRLTGGDLKIGGEGMKTFYDKLLVNEMNKFFGKTKWGKARVETAMIDGGGKEQWIYRGPFYTIDKLESWLDNWRDEKVFGEIEPNYVYNQIYDYGRQVLYNIKDMGLKFSDAMERNGTPELAKALGGEMLKLYPEAEVHSIVITDEMRDIAMGGMPMFSLKDQNRISPMGEDFEQSHIKQTDPREREETRRALSLLLNPFKHMQNPLDTGETIGEALIRKMQDKYIHLKKLQKRLGRGSPLDEKMDVYLAEEIFHGKVAWQLEQFEKKYVEPLMKRISDFGINAEEFDDYLYAAHAQERNERIWEINPDFRKREIAGSGMTQEEADKIIRDFAGRGLLKKMKILAATVYKMNDARLGLLLKAGMIDEKQHKTIRNMYKKYVPLRGKAGEPDFLGTGKGMSVPDSGIKRALGRKSRAQSPLAWSLGGIEETIVKVHKNEVGKKLLNLIREFKDKDLWTIDEITTKQRWNPVMAEVETIHVPAWAQKDLLHVWEDGKRRNIKIKNPLLARALLNIGMEKTNAVVGALAAFNRYLAAVNTSLNPEFVLSNFIRDIQTAGINLTAEQSTGLMRKVMADVPNALRHAYRGYRGKPGIGEWGDWFKKYRANGGSIGFFGLRGIGDRVRVIEKMIGKTRAGFLPSAKRGITEVTGFISDLNSAVENAVRLATFKNAVQSGLSPARAASLSKNLTVNFNRKGELGFIMNSFYLFYNAGIQGTARVLQVMKSRGGRILGASIAGAAFMMTELNRFLGGDDPDDKRNYYDKIPPYTKERSIIIMIPDSGGQYIKFPLPYGYNIFWVIGEQVNTALHSGKPVEGAINILNAAVDAFNPMGGDSSLIRTISPTLTDLPLDLYMNQNFAGYPIKPDQPQWGLPKPQSWLYWRTVSPISKFLAQKVNQLTGGSPVRPGKIDVSPEIIDYLANFFTGAMGAFVNRSLNIGMTVAKGEELPVHKTPFERIFHGVQPEFSTGQDYRKVREEIMRRMEETELKLPPRTGGLPGALKFKYEMTERKINKAYKRIKAIEAGGLSEKRKKELVDEKRKEIQDAQKELIKQFDKTIGEQPWDLIDVFQLGKIQIKETK